MWNLHPAEEPVADLQTIADLYAGRRADKNGGLVPLAAEEMSTVRKSWLAKHPARFASAADSPDR
jgi:hypothetical protein